MGALVSGPLALWVLKGLSCCSAVLCCGSPQAPAVRMTAADNLGELTRLSARLEQLVADLAGSAAAAADLDTSAAYLTALRGALRASGDRLTPPTPGQGADPAPQPLQDHGQQDRQQQR